MRWQRGVLALCTLTLLGGCASREYYYLDEKYGKEYQDYNPQPQKLTLPTISSWTKLSASTPTMRPYEVFGKQYVPSFVEVGEELSGVASWYGPDFHGKKTSNGESYDMYAMTAAHKTLPMNTIVKVSNKLNGKQVVVRVNDRGPFVEGRIIDLSYAAGKEAGIDQTGTAPVVVTVLGFDNTIVPMSQGERRIIGSFMVQIGAYKNPLNAQNFATKCGTIDSLYTATVKTYGGEGEGLSRVMLTGFKSEGEARDFIAQRRFPGAFVVAE